MCVEFAPPRGGEEEGKEEVLRRLVTPRGRRIFRGLPLKTITEALGIGLPPGLGFIIGGSTGPRRGGRGFKRFLEAVGSILAEFGPKPSHGSPIRHQNCGFGTYDMC